METDANAGIAVVGISDLRIGQSPLVIETTLGSCIAVCLYAPRLRVGGMLHIMMPYVNEAAYRGVVPRAKYANTGIPELIRQLTEAYAVQPPELVAKIFGGGQVLRSMTTHVGQMNETAVRDVLSDLQINIAAARTGGQKGYKVALNLETGTVRCQVFGETSEEF